MPEPTEQQIKRIRDNIDTVNRLMKPLGRIRELGEQLLSVVSAPGLGPQCEIAAGIVSRIRDAEKELAGCGGVAIGTESSDGLGCLPSEAASIALADFVADMAADDHLSFPQTMALVARSRKSMLRVGLREGWAPPRASFNRREVEKATRELRNLFDTKAATSGASNGPGTPRPTPGPFVDPGAAGAAERASSSPLRKILEDAGIIPPGSTQTH